MGRTSRVCLHPFYELWILQGAAYSAARNEQDVSRRAIRKSVGGDKLLTEGGVNRFQLFRNAINLEACFAKDFPRPTVIDHFSAIEQEHSYTDPLFLVIDLLNQFHPAAGTYPRFVKDKLVTFLSAFGTDKDPFRCRGRTADRKD